MPLTAESMKVFDEVLEYYNWAEHKDDTIMDKLTDTNNFSPSNYKSAVSCYLNWSTVVYPATFSEDKDDIKLAMAQQVFNILHQHAPKHQIHVALSKY